MLGERGNEDLDVGDGAVGRVDGAVVADVVAHVVLGRRVDGREPDGGDAEGGQVGHARDDAAQGADAAGGEGEEAGGVDLVDHGGVEPFSGRGGGGWGHGGGEGLSL